MLNYSNIPPNMLQLLILVCAIAFALILGKFRPEWKSRKTIISWIWTVAVLDLIIMDSKFAKTTSAHLLIGGAIVLNVINFIGDRVEKIQFKSFSASLKKEEEYESQHTINNNSKKPTKTKELAQAEETTKTVETQGAGE